METERRLVFTCGREPSYPRNAFIQAVLKDHFIVQSVTESSRSLPVRYARLALRYPFIPWRKSSLVIAGFVGQPLALMLRLFTSQKIILDAFISIYDTVCYDRKWFDPNSLPGRLAFWLDKESTKRSSLVLLDTHAHAAYFNETFQVPWEKLRVLFVGCDEAIFTPAGDTRYDENLVLFYGSFLPLHGIDVIVRAASLVEKNTPIKFRIIGAGMESGHVHQLVRQLNVKNIEFCPPVPLKQLPRHIAEASICLGGHFGKSAKAGRVIAGKTFQSIAMAKATIVGENAANRELLTHGEDAWFCRMDDPQALADAIQTLVTNRRLREQIGRNARETFLARASYRVLGEQLRSIVRELLGDHPPR